MTKISSVGILLLAVSAVFCTPLYGQGVSPAAPTASVGTSAVPGSATTYMRSDAAPAINQSISPTWTGTHTFNTTIRGPVSGQAVQQQGTTAELDPWAAYLTRGVTYQYVISDRVGVTDTVDGTIWNFNHASKMFSINSSAPAGDNSLNVPTTAFLASEAPIHVANNTALAAFPLTAYPVIRDGFATVGDGGRAVYNWSSSACTLASGAGDGGSQVPRTAGGCWLIDWASVKFQAIMPVFGAVCNGNNANANADTVAAQNAAHSGYNVYMPTNNYCIFNAPITLSSLGQKFYGDGPQASKILILTTYGTSFQGVITLSQPAQQVKDIGITFSQPDFSGMTISNLTIYQPGIMARFPATVIDNVLIVQGTTCIDMGGNSNAGNSYLTNIDTGCYKYGIRLDGSLDSVRINAHHHFPFQMSVNQTPLFSNSIGVDMGRVDDYVISNGLCLGSICLNFYTGAQGGAFGAVTGFDFDGATQGILMQSASASLVGSALTFSSGSASQHAITQSAGKLIISGSSFFETVPSILDQFTGGIQIITGSEWNQQTYNAPLINANATSGSRLTLTGNNIERDPSTTFTNPWLSSNGSEIIIVGSNSVTPTSHSAPFISIANDTAGSRVTGNSSPGWSNYVASALMPNSLSPASSGVYYGN